MLQNEGTPREIKYSTSISRPPSSVDLPDIDSQFGKPSPYLTPVTLHFNHLIYGKQIRIMYTEEHENLFTEESENWECLTLEVD